MNETNKILAIIMKSAKIHVSIIALSAFAALALLAVFVLAPSVIWTSNADWSGLNNTLANGAILG